MNTTAPAAQLPTAGEFLRAAMSAAVALYGQTGTAGDRELAPGVGLLEHDAMGVAVAGVCAMIDGGHGRAAAVDAIVTALYTGIETEGAREQARAEAGKFLAWVETFRPAA